jgi:cytochrome P450
VEAIAKSIIDFAIRARGPDSSSFTIKFEELLDQALMLQSGGAQSAVMGIHSNIYFLSQDPSVQDQLREEIRAIVPPPDVTLNNPVNPAILQYSMLYLNAVINVVLRLHSAFSWTGRVPQPPSLSLESTSRYPPAQL